MTTAPAGPVLLIALPAEGAALATAIPTPADECLNALIEPQETPQSRQILDQTHQILSASALSVADLTGIAIEIGPGGFSRIRVACALAQGLALARDLPILGLDSLAVTAEACAIEARAAGEADGPLIINVVCDAKMAQLYTARVLCDDGQAPVLLMASALMSVEQCQDWLAHAPDNAKRVVGDGLARYRQELAGAIGHDPAPVPGTENRSNGWQILDEPDALSRLKAICRQIRRLEGWAEAERLQPNYVRDNVALSIPEQQALRERRRVEKENR